MFFVLPVIGNLYPVTRNILSFTGKMYLTTQGVLFYFYVTRNKFPVTRNILSFTGKEYFCDRYYTSFVCVIPIREIVPSLVMSIPPMSSNSIFPVKRTIFLVRENIGTSVRRSSWSAFGRPIKNDIIFFFFFLFFSRRLFFS